MVLSPDMISVHPSAKARTEHQKDQNIGAGQVVLWMGLNSNDLKLLSALVVAVFLAIPYMKGKYFSKPVKRGGAPRA